MSKFKCMMHGCKNKEPGKYFKERDIVLYCAEHEKIVLEQIYEMIILKNKNMEAKFEKDLTEDLSKKMKGLL